MTDAFVYIINGCQNYAILRKNRTEQNAPILNQMELWHSQTKTDETRWALLDLLIWFTLISLVLVYMLAWFMANI